MADIFTDPGNFVEQSAETPMLDTSAADPYTAPGAAGTGGFDLATFLSSMFGGSNNPLTGGLVGALGGLLPSLGAIASGGQLGTTTQAGNTTGTTAYNQAGTTNQTSDFSNLLSQMLQGTNFQNALQNQQQTAQQQQNMQGGFNQAGTGGFNQAQQGGFGQQQQGGMTQATQGGFGQQQQGGMTQATTGGFGQQQTGGMTQGTTGGMTQQAIQNLNQQMTPIMMPEAQQAGAATASALAGLMPQAQGLWGQGAGLLGQLGPQAMALLQQAGGPGPIPMPTIDLIKQAFEPFVQSIGDQAITAARNAGFAGGADLLGGAGSPLAGRALATVPGQEAAALLQAQQTVPMTNAQIQNMQMQAMLGALQGGAGIAGSMMNPLASAIQQQLGLVTAYPTGQSLTGQNTTNTTGTNFGNTTGTTFNNAAGTNFGNTTGSNFNNATGTNFGNTAGTTFNNAAGTNFGNTSGTNFQNLGGTNFQNTNSQSLQNLINSLNQTGGFNQTGQTQQSGQASQQGSQTQTGGGNTTGTTNATTTQSVPIPTLVGTAAGNALAGGLSGVNTANTNAANQAQNTAFMNLISQALGAGNSIFNAI